MYSFSTFLEKYILSNKIGLARPQSFAKCGKLVSGESDHRFHRINAPSCSAKPIPVVAHIIHFPVFPSSLPSLSLLFLLLFPMSDGLGPHLSGSRGIGDHQHHHHHRHSSAVGDDDAEVIETSSRTERRGSRATSHSTRHRFLNGLTAPLHDRHGRPIRRHGQETFGDALMHPFREYELHKQRMKEYEEEMKKWVHSHIDEEKFQRSAPLEEAAPTP